MVCPGAAETSGYKNLRFPRRAPRPWRLNTDALIVDLRLASYFFGDRPVHLNDLYWRDTNRIIQFWTDPKVPGRC